MPFMQWLEKKWPGETLFLHHEIQSTKRKNAAHPGMEELDSRGNRIPRILLTPIGIGGEGLNLTRARHVMLLDVLCDPSSSTSKRTRETKHYCSPDLIH